MNGVKGISLIWHLKEALYLGKFVAGIFSDNNYHYRNPRKEGWGIKLDIFFAPIIRPVPRFWERDFYKGQKGPKIWDEYDNIGFWGAALWGKLAAKRTYGIVHHSKIPKLNKVNDFKFGIFNPWKGKYWFVLRIPAVLPLAFFSFSTPWRSFYIGFKTSKIEPYLDRNHTVDQGDYTWCGHNERKLADKVGGSMFRSAVPSGSIRRKRT